MSKHSKRARARRATKLEDINEDVCGSENIVFPGGKVALDSVIMLDSSKMGTVRNGMQKDDGPTCPA